MEGSASRGSARVEGLKGEEVHEGRGRERGKGRAIKGGECDFVEKYARCLFYHRVVIRSAFWLRSSSMY